MAKVSSSEIAARYEEGELVSSLVSAAGSFRQVYAALRKHNVSLRQGNQREELLIQTYLTLDDAITTLDWGMVVSARDQLDSIIASFPVRGD